MIELHDDDPSAVEFLLEWIYGKNFYSCDPLNTAVEELRLYIAAYVVANKYGVEALTETLLGMFNEYVNYKPLPADTLLRLTQLVYATTENELLRDVVAGACKARASDLLSFECDWISFKAVLEEFEELWADLAKASQRTHSWRDDAW